MCFCVEQALPEGKLSCEFVDSLLEVIDKRLVSGCSPSAFWLDLCILAPQKMRAAHSAANVSNLVKDAAQDLEVNRSCQPISSTAELSGSKLSKMLALNLTASFSRVCDLVLFSKALRKACFGN